MSLLFPRTVTRADLAAIQAERLAALFAAIVPKNRFYTNKFANLDLATIRSVEDLRRLPMTTKAELLADQASSPPFGLVLTFPLADYTRYHQTSGTSGRPLRWLDTNASWASLLQIWAALYEIAGITPADRLLFAFSFGPFLGFWSAFDAASQLGCLCLPGGGMSSTARLRFLLDNEVTVVLCTPTYALHLAEVAQREKIDLAASAVRAVLVAGEPGGNIPATRARIETGWGARVLDHNGMTETGPFGIECAEAPGGLHLLETACIAEVVDSAGEPIEPGNVGELVFTGLLRTGSPLVRYRTGDLVCVASEPCRCGRVLMRLEGGIRGRADDMIVIRGNNVHPSAIQRVLHGFAEVDEFRVEFDQSDALAALRVQIEPRHTPPAGTADLVARIERAIRDEFLFRAEVVAVAPGTLPRAEMKAQRFVRK